MEGYRSGIGAMAGTFDEKAYREGFEDGVEARPSRLLWFVIGQLSAVSTCLLTMWL